MKYDIFISYRREGGYDTAKHLNDLLVRDGYRVSFDIDTLRRGDFDVQLLSRIEECKDFILIVDEHAFDRTLDKNFDSTKDWMRCELAHALKHNKNIIPVFLSGVTGFPDGLPEDIVNVTKKNGPEYNRYYFNDFYKTLKKRFLHKRSKRLYLYIGLCVLSLLALIPLVSPLLENTPMTNEETQLVSEAILIGDNIGIVESSHDIEFYSRKRTDSYDELYAKVDGLEYKVDLPSEMCLDVVEQRDFDLDGVDDVLVENIQACGGNAMGNSYFFIKYDGTGFFSVTNEFGNNVWERPKVENWNGVPSVLIVDIGTDCIFKERYILKQGKAVRVESFQKQSVTVLKEVRNSDFTEDTNEKIMKYDLNDDGIDEEFMVSYWLVNNTVLFTLNMNNKIYECRLGANRVGISSMITNGYHDIVIGNDTVYKWNGYNYVCSEDELEIVQ